MWAAGRVVRFCRTRDERTNLKNKQSYFVKHTIKHFHPEFTRALCHSYQACHFLPLSATLPLCHFARGTHNERVRTSNLSIPMSLKNLQAAPETYALGAQHSTNKNIPKTQNNYLFEHCLMVAVRSERTRRAYTSSVLQRMVRGAQVQMHCTNTRQIV